MLRKAGLFVGGLAKTAESEYRRRIKCPSETTSVSLGESASAQNKLTCTVAGLDILPPTSGLDSELRYLTSGSYPKLFLLLLCRQGVNFGTESRHPKQSQEVRPRDLASETAEVRIEAFLRRWRVQDTSEGVPEKQAKTYSERIRLR
ncbi:unnamed protein product [Urochloa humidicola]